VVRKHRTPLNLEERAQIEAFLGEGKTYYYIALQIGRAPSLISKEVSVGSINGRYDHKHAQEEAEKRRQKIGAFYRRPLSEDQIQEMIHIASQGISIYEIAKKFRCSATRVSKITGISPKNLTNTSGSVSLLSRVDSLEEQVKILFETIKELTK
jgi:IS30 family transposase